MTNLELDALRRSSHVYRAPLADPRQLVSLHLHGPRHDPWATLKFDPELARLKLGARVIGQQVAIDTAVEVINAAYVGIDFEGPGVRATRPRGTFLLVGPTGTGKTEFSKALCEYIFGHEDALFRLDMSEYRQEHAAERLVGSPPGYVAHDRGGVLTNAALENPFRAFLFDEIDKAHPGVLELFLQILDDGRLTDGQGRTAYFNQALLIFTSNEGSGSLHTLMGNGVLPPYEDIRDHYLAAVRHKLAIDLRRPELLGRFGDGIVVFDILRPEVMGAITAKFLQLLQASAAARHGVQVSFDVQGVTAGVTATIASEGTIGSGGRQIRTEVDRHVRRRLASWWSTHWPVPGSVVEVSWPEGSEAVEIHLKTQP
jgi:ATP-dependent Clp protease ATP-binding subunit ClpA